MEGRKLRLKKSILQPYQPIEPPFEAAKRLGVKDSQLIKLNANENPYGCLPEVLASLSNCDRYHIYPDPAQRRLKSYLAKYAGCAEERLLVGSGADEILDLVCRFLLKPAQKVLLFPPCFPYYWHLLQVNNLQAVELSRNDSFLIDEKMLSDFDFSTVDLVIVASPNNPTGDLLDLALLEKILKQKVNLLLDEAYYEFSQVTALDLLDSYPNLILCRTLSKMFGLAGLRIGYGIMAPQLAAELNKLRAPYNVNVAAEEALVASLANLKQLEQQRRLIIQTKDRVYNALKAMPKLLIFPSEANFILIKPLAIETKFLHQELEKHGILTRSYDSGELSSFIRVTIGTPSQMDVFLKQLAAIIR